MAEPVIIIDPEGLIEYMHVPQGANFNPVNAIGRNIYDFIFKKYRETFQRCVQSVLDHRELEYFETQVAGSQGETLYYKCCLGPVIDQENITGLILLIKDITDYKQAEQEIAQYRTSLETMIHDRTVELRISNKELKNAQMQLIQSAKLSSLGEMANGVAHELNNPLGIISLATEVCLEMLEEGDYQAVKIQLNNILKQVQRGAQIITHLRRFSKDSMKVNWEYIDLNSIIENSFTLISEQFKLRGIKVVKDFAENLPKCYCNPLKLEQVFVNLLSNARDALEMTDAPKIVVKSGLEEQWLVIEVADNGFGIGKKNIDKIFDPFYTTKEVGKGTGLGLSISYGIVQEHKGKLEVQSEIGTGSVFKVFVPVVKPYVGISQMPLTS
ncbi:MAG: PAS domain S-box protein [SAR324 cluster bacterium]|nr:PAS domain S-box protein [SAR324 cluster bacterium]